MAFDRSLLRLFLPALAAASLVAMWATPGLARASNQLTVPSRSSPPAASTPGDGGPGVGTSGVMTGIPAVAFTETVSAVGGHLRTPVLINISEVPGRVTVVGAGQGSDCRADARPGVVLWLDCSLNPEAAKNPHIRVTLDDGRRVEKPIRLG